jgi:hypothetical protein
MIHRDLCDPKNTKNYSVLRMQFHFVLARFACWDGFIPLTEKEIAEQITCDVQSIKKFIKQGIRDQIISLKGDRLYLLKHIPSEEYKEGYVKHFQFLESKDFTSLNIHTQRFILYTLWRGVHTGMPLITNVTSLYHSNEHREGKLNLYNRNQLNQVIEEAKVFLKIQMEVKKGQDRIRVYGLQDKYAHQKALENQGESRLLENLLFSNNCDGILSSETCKNVLKLKKEYYRKLDSVGIELFSNALKKLLLSFKLFQLEQAKEVTKYLRSIIKDYEQQLLPTIQKRIKNTRDAIERTKDLVVSQAGAWLQRFEHRLQHLHQLYQRLNKIEEEKNHGFFKLPSVSHIGVKQDLSVPFPFFNWLEE